MAYGRTKKRTSSRLEHSATSIEPVKSTTRRLRTKRNVKDSPNKSVQYNVNPKKSPNVSKTKQSLSVKRQSTRKINNSQKRKSQAKKTNNKSKDASQNEESKNKDIVKQKKGAGIKNSGKVTKKTVVNKRKDKLNDSISLRQMSLKESFSKQAVRARLRPRGKEKNYCEETRLADKSKNSMVLGQIADTKKGPVYKHINRSEDVEGIGTDVYDFKFDDNDSRERRVRKKRKRVMRTGILKRNVKKKALEKRALTAKVAKVVMSEEALNVNIKPIKITPDSHVQHDEVEIKDKSMENVVVDVSIPVNEIDSNCESMGSVQAVEQRDIPVSKPQITSVRNFDHTISTIGPATKNPDNRLTTVRASDSFVKPPTQCRSMINHSLLNKSLSPIVKTGDNFDVGSPWRPPQVFTFSHIKDLFQSTPHIKKLDGYTSKTVRNLNNIENVALKRMDVEKNKNILLTRKFGTEITNIDNSIPSSPNVEDRNDRVPEPQPLQSFVQSDLPMITTTPNVSFNDVAEDKENAAPNFQTPRKIMIKKKKKKLQTTQNTLGRKVLQSKENEPQPGPSHLQSTSPLKEDKVLRQSNLSGFLNLTPMPESSNILTRHGIFSDIHSTPVNGKQPKKVQKTQDDMENAFGFNDSDSDLNISPINADGQAENGNKMEKPAVANIKTETVVPARLSIGEIQRKLLVPKKAKNKGPVQTILPRPINQVKENVNKEDPRKKVLIDISNFSDTFDVLSEVGDSVKDESVKDFPLFVDLEPSRFIEPPKHSYKRKRNVRFNYLGDTDDENDNEADHEPEIKKKKANKLSKADERRLQTWVKDVNETFEEIDQFDLLIE